MRIKISSNWATPRRISDFDKINHVAECHWSQKILNTVTHKMLGMSSNFLCFMLLHIAKHHKKRLNRRRMRKSIFFTNRKNVFFYVWNFLKLFPPIRSKILSSEIFLPEKFCPKLSAWKHFLPEWYQPKFFYMKWIILRELHRIIKKISLSFKRNFIQFLLGKFHAIFKDLFARASKLQQISRRRLATCVYPFNWEK